MKVGGFLKGLASPLVGIMFAAVGLMSNQPTRVLVAKHDLFPNQTLQTSDLTLQPMHDLLPGALKGTEQETIVGLRVASRIPAGYPVLKASLSGKPGVGMSLADTIPDANHAIYQLEASRAHLPRGGVVPGDTVMLSVVLKMDAAQQAALAQAQATPTATPAPAPAPKPADQAVAFATPPPLQSQAPLILGSQFVTAPVVAVSAPNSTTGPSLGSSNDGYMSVLLTLDNHNALTLLQGSGLADITVSLASSENQEAGRVNTFTQLVNVLERQQQTGGNVARSADQGTPANAAASAVGSASPSLSSAPASPPTAGPAPQPSNSARPQNSQGR